MRHSFWIERGRLPAGAFTIVELMVVVFIIGLLIAMLLPAVQQAREAARAVECKNHLHQISLALLNHADTVGNFPSSGWGWMWPPYPPNGDGVRQPGSWVYTILPYLEADALHSVAITNQARQATVLPMFYCPSRRAAELYPCANPGVLPPIVALVAKSDYAANTGDHNEPNAAGPLQTFVQPSTLDEGDNEAWWTAQGVARTATGIIFQRSRIRPAEISDGLSQTYLLGEKYLNPDDYTTGAGLGDMESVYHGDNDDTSRVTYTGNTIYASPDVYPGDGPPRQDQSGFSSRTLFGSAHPGGCHFVLADGSVRVVAYSIDVEAHRRLGNRCDGLPSLPMP